MTCPNSLNRTAFLTTIAHAEGTSGPGFTINTIGSAVVSAGAYSIEGNGGSGARFFGGVAAAVMQVTETMV